MLIDEILELPAGERIEIVKAIWDSVAAYPEDVPLSDAQRDELERRWQDLERDPGAGEPWESVKHALHGE